MTLPDKIIVIDGVADASALPPHEARPLDHGGPVERPFQPAPAAWEERPIFELFSACAAAHADKPAVDDGETFLTYAELEERARELARRIAPSAGRGEAIGIALPNGATYLVAILAALASGHPYLPLDLGFPVARTALLLKRAGVKAVVVDKTTRAAIAAIDPAMKQIELDGGADAGGARPEPAPVADAALILYTSGSEGEPKGVGHTQRTLLHNAIQRINGAHISAADRLLLLAAQSVAAAIQDIFPVLLVGATLFITDIRGKGFQEVIRVIGRQRITIYNSSPSVFRRLCALAAPADLASIRWVNLGTDRVLSSDIALFRRRFAPDAVMSTRSGSSEALTYAGWFYPRDMDFSEALPPVGYILPGYRVALIDETGNAVAHGEPGEIVVTSRYLALGYWNDAELTRRFFSVRPDDPAARVFRTGDLGRMRPEGLLEMVGRRDRQIKLRGQRIEPAEIEAAIRLHPGVADAAIVSSGTGDDIEIAAYVVAGTEGALSPQEVTAWLRERLPAAMRPHQVIFVDEIPMLGNFKQDIQKLKEIHAARPRAPQAEGAASVRVPSERRTSTSDGAALAAVRAQWTRAVGAKAFAADLSWDEAGGNSLQALEMMFEIEGALRRPVPMALLGPATRPSALVAALQQILDGRPADAGPAGARLELFFLPGWPGPMLHSMRLVEALTERFEVHVLDYPEISPRAPCHFDFDAILDHAMAQFRATASRDQPIRLIGFSFGSAVAFEAARRLTSEGYTVEFLGVIDAPPYYGPDWTEPAPEDLALIPRYIVGRFAERYIERRFLENRFDSLARVGRALTVLPSKRWRHFFRQRLKKVSRTRALRVYQPQHFSGAVNLFKSLGNTRWREMDAPDDLGWSEFCDRVEILPLRGDHLSIFAPPQLEATVDVITSALHAQSSAAAGAQAKRPPPPDVRRTIVDPMMEAAQIAADPFAAIKAGTDAHRARHGCYAHAYSAGAMLGVVAGTANAKRILELGTALGYSSLTLAHGAPEAHIDTVERDPEHVRIARENIAAYGYGDRITVHEDDYRNAMARLEPSYDLIFFDGYGPTMEDLEQFRRLLRPRGILLSSNLSIGSQAATFRAALLQPDQWLTTFAVESGHSAISLKL